jgi:hypothetical protein
MEESKRARVGFLRILEYADPGNRAGTWRATDLSSTNVQGPGARGRVRRRPGGERRQKDAID